MEEVWTPSQKPSWLSCVLCTHTYASSDRQLCDCGGQLEVKHDFSPWQRKGGEYLKAKFDLRRMRSKHKTLAERRADETAWRFRDLTLPGVVVEELVTRGEGDAPLYYDFRRTCKWLGLSRAYFAHLGQTPTGSHKDYGMAVAMTRAKIGGVRTVICASTGNTAASVASYAAAAGMKAVILLPDCGASPCKMAQSLAYGAKVVLVRGDYDTALKMVREAHERLGFSIMNSINPWRIEGHKAIAFEFLEQLEWRAPDWIVVPGGNLGNAAAMHKACSEAFDLGMIDHVPRIAIVQAHGAAPFYLSRQAGWQRTTVEARTVASAIRIGNPVNYDKAKRAVIATDGIAVRVTDPMTLEAKAMVDADGRGAETASCVAVAGLKQLVETDVITPDQSVVVTLTGSFLKDSQVAADYHSSKIVPGSTYVGVNPPVTIDATAQALDAALAPVI